MIQSVCINSVSPILHPLKVLNFLLNSSKIYIVNVDGFTEFYGRSNWNESS